ncbi:hypothetical protein MMC25_002381 [Agyrium rufum]|nr:hypothetical protein [Agyrium rufum]
MEIANPSAFRHDTRDFAHPQTPSERAYSSRPQSSLSKNVYPSIEQDEGFRTEDEDDAFNPASLSGSNRGSSGPDELIFDATSSTHSSPRTSHASSLSDNEEISLLPLDSREPSCPPPLVSTYVSSSPYATLKSTTSGVKNKRLPFRNPSSVRAIQLETTPPPFHLSSPTASIDHYAGVTSPPGKHKQRNPSKVSNISRNSTPFSNYSNTSRNTSPSKLSPRKRAAAAAAAAAAQRKENPLVLLHVTVLPLAHRYTQAVMDSVLPPHLLDNWKVLREKVTDTVLERGVLIGHPQEEYEVLEERLLESLELRVPRILTCGHFHRRPVTSRKGSQADWDAGTPDDEWEEGEEVVRRGSTGITEVDEESRRDLANLREEACDEDMCHDCHRRMRDGRFGTSGEGSRRWDVKVYAANGLMRAGAWSAAWREMERVDVEIQPWIGEEWRRQLELKSQEIEHHVGLPMNEEALIRTHSSIPAVRDGFEYGDHHGATQSAMSSPGPKMDDARLREIYGDDIPVRSTLEDMQIDPVQVEPRLRSKKRSSRRVISSSKYHGKEEIPLWILLKNVIFVAAQDRRNIGLAVLSLLVVFLAIRPSEMAVTVPNNKASSPPIPPVVWHQPASPPPPSPPLKSLPELGNVHSAMDESVVDATETFCSESHLDADQDGTSESAYMEHIAEILADTL